MPFIDLTHTFTSTMPVYPGDPLPELVQIAHLAEHGYNDFQLKTGMHVGTHMDGPLHMLPSGKKLSEYPAYHFFGRGRLSDARGKAKIDEELLDGLSLSRGDIVVVHSGFGEKFGTEDYFENYPELTEAFARKLISVGIKILALDTPSPDRAPFHIHKMLLEKDILIIENLANTAALIGVAEFEIIALPSKLDADSAPVRVVARSTVSNA